MIHGDISIGICQTRDLPANAKRRTLRPLQYRVLRDPFDNAPLEIDEYCARPHVAVSQSANTVSYLDKYLAELGRKRRVVLSLPRYSSLPAILRGSNLIATIQDFAAASIAEAFGLRSEPPPFEIPSSSLSLSWLSNTDGDPGERWLLSKIIEVMGDELPLFAVQKPTQDVAHSTY